MRTRLKRTGAACKDGSSGKNGRSVFAARRSAADAENAHFIAFEGDFFGFFAYKSICSRWRDGES